MERILVDIYGILVLVLIQIAIIVWLVPDALTGWGKEGKEENKKEE